MNYEPYKIIALLFTVFGLIFAIYQYLKSKPKYKFHMFNHVEVNTDDCGTYLCARIHISNVGGKTGVFSGFIAVDSNNEEYYPINTFEIDKEIEPGKTISGAIPIGHLISYPPKALYMQNGVFEKIKIPNKLLKNTISALQEDKEKYIKNSFEVNPTNGIK